MKEWNANIHYDGLLERLIGPAPKDVLDVGCGDGFLSARLAGRGHRVVALDLDAPVLARARTRWPEADVEWRQGDVLEAELGPFDAVVSNATLHHLPDAGEAFARLGWLVRPGGVVAVVGFAQNVSRAPIPATAARAVSGGVEAAGRRVGSLHDSASAPGSGGRRAVRGLGSDHAVTVGRSHVNPAATESR